MGDTKLVFKISPNGELTVEAVNFKGKSCLKEAEKYIQAFGRITSQSLKPDYFEEGMTKINITN